MTRFISPSKDELHHLRTPLTIGEKRVFEFFNQNLSEDWEIYIQPHLNGLRPDFVLLNPKVGIAVFEVKDWDLAAMPYHIRYSSTESNNPELWATSRDGRNFRIKDNPVEKVLLYKNSIANLYCPQINNNCADQSTAYLSLITAGVIVTTADTRSLEELFSPFYQARNLLGKAKLYHPLAGCDALLLNDLETVFPTANRWRISKFMKPELATSLRGWLVEPDFSATQRQPLELNPKQRQLATSRTISGYRRIRGAAGSGKSLVLAARAAQLSIEYKDTLVVSFNITLWHYLRDLAVRYSLPGKTINRYITWLHFHEWCKQVICGEAGLDNEYKALWRENSNIFEILEIEIVQLTNKAIDIAGTQITKYDVILVDEGQDYNPIWWNTLRRVLKADREMVLVADETQDLYERARSWTEDAMNGAGFSGPWVQLETCYRMPHSLIKYLRDFAKRYLPDLKLNLPTAQASELDLYPTNLRWLQLSSSQSVSRECVSAALKMPGLATPDVIAYPDIVLLLPTHKLGLACVSLLNEQKFNVIHIFDEDQQEQKSRKMAFFMGDARIKACTIHSFKGWEARYMVIAISEDTNIESAYVAMSRLKRHTEGSYLTVVCSNPILEDFGRTWENFIRL
ncbi:Superfamily I DNA and RNA helicase [Gloeomargarita lithophora Alchichica-D10]|uniref:Superfamily I DNA and RNA helicase n=1 Tax=Gloeomargarita lithophora Alchichica-D10 TaxID=1188229 RepID=A0A1J0ABB5_9CYAN|nr:nuclease-related domain-containing protein [Gloeomargarita lithophora]APB33226.1 Superfamily I DNA and RNA helicase [Gloeomargarita lithophora Alchichica-D10]